MVEIIDGKLTGTVEIPVEDLTLYALLKYADMSQYTSRQIADALGKTPADVISAKQAVIRRTGKDVKLLGSKGGRIGRKNRKVTIEETDSITTRRLKQKFLLSGDNMRTLSKAIGVSNTTVIFWMYSGSIPSTENLRKLADHYNTTVAWLSGQTNNPMRRF